MAFEGCCHLFIRQTDKGSRHVQLRIAHPPNGIYRVRRVGDDLRRLPERFSNSQYADKVNDYLVEVYLTSTKLRSRFEINQQIKHPSTKILEAKQDILFQLGTQAFANVKLDDAVSLFSQAIQLGSYNMEARNDAYFWRGESYYRMGEYETRYRTIARILNNTRQRNTDMYALAYYNFRLQLFQTEGLQCGPEPFPPIY